MTTAGTPSKRKSIAFSSRTIKGERLYHRIEGMTISIKKGWLQAEDLS
jgi:hypothetical protein